MTRAFGKMLNRNDKNRHFYLVPDHRGESCSFYSFSIMLAVGFPRCPRKRG